MKYDIISLKQTLCFYLFFHSVCVQAAETGSGKTGAFCLPILQTVWETLSDQKSGKTKKGSGGGGGGGAQCKLTSSIFLTFKFGNIYLLHEW